MSPAELDALPQGIIRVDKSAKIICYNAAQATLAHRPAQTTIGLNFFRDVAPCADVKDFHGRFNDFVLKEGAMTETFSFVFRFGWGQESVSITMVKPADPDGSIYLVVNRSVLN